LPRLYQEWKARPSKARARVRSLALNTPILILTYVLPVIDVNINPKETTNNDGCAC
jgi:hypothetical protein